eukprot:624578-Pelagomonas_calceolata.AAC.3
MDAARSSAEEEAGAEVVAHGRRHEAGAEVVAHGCRHEAGAEAVLVFVRQKHGYRQEAGA